MARSPLPSCGAMLRAQSKIPVSRPAVSPGSPPKLGDACGQEHKRGAGWNFLPPSSYGRFLRRQDPPSDGGRAERSCSATLRMLSAAPETRQLPCRSSMAVEDVASSRDIRWENIQLWLVHAQLVLRHNLEENLGFTTRINLIFLCIINGIL